MSIRIALITIVAALAAVPASAVAADDPDTLEVVADEARAEIFPNMPANQLEQLLIRFGLQLADEYDEPGSVHIHIRRPAAEPAHRKGDEFAGYIVMGVASPGASFEPESYTPDTAPALSRDGGGVVQSVALSFLERQGGQLTVLVREGGFHAFRIGLTALDERAAPLGEGEETLRLEGANALLVQPAIWSDGVTSALLEEIGASVTVVNNIVGGMDRLERRDTFGLVVIDELLLGMDPGAMIDRIRKRAPAISVIVLQGSRAALHRLPSDVAAVRRPVTGPGFRLALANARRLAAARFAPKT